MSRTGIILILDDGAQLRHSVFMQTKVHSGANVFAVFNIRLGEIITVCVSVLSESTFNNTMIISAGSIESL